MKRTSLFFLAFLTLGVAGCGDDDGPAPTPDAGPQPMDQCLNSGDGAILTSDGGDASAVATDCASMTCIGDLVSDPNGAGKTCMEGCMDADPGVGGLTMGCRDCFVGAALCAAVNCAVPCGILMDMAMCDQCRVDNGCDTTFETCSGLSSSLP